MIPPHEPLSEKLRRILVNDSPTGLTLNELIRRTEGRGIFLIIILFSLPFVAPIGLAGLSNVLGWIIMLLGIRLARKLPPRLPGFIGERPLPSAHLEKIARGSVKLLQFIERLVRPRRTNWMSWRFVHCANAVLLAFMGFMLALPLPPLIPFSNALPCYAIILIAASMMEEDGFLIWFGYAMAVATVVYFVLLSEVIIKFFATVLRSRHDVVSILAMKYHWMLATPQPVLAAHIASQLKLSPLLAQCLLNRGHSEPAQAERFLDPRLKQLADPFLLPDMGRAVERLIRARDTDERIVIFGDYDVDGVTSTALLLEVFRSLGWQADFYLPRRLEEGYGLSQDGVENCLAKYPTSLLLAVDCGSTATATIAWLLERGVDVLVLDHHQVSNPPPPAVALVNPQLSAAGTPSFRELCSVGLAFKLAHALLKRLRELENAAVVDFDLRPLLDLVALGTVADLVPLIGENRILVTAGLERLATTRRSGLQALKAVAQVKNAVGVYEIGFQLAPRLNAAGRLENAAQALHLLLVSDPREAQAIAAELDARNRERQQIERAIAGEVIGAVRARFNPETDFAIVEGQLLWHIGVVGIVASRVLREFYRPTIIIGGEGGDWRGSGRSIEGFDLAAALRECDDLLVRHGGHAMAAGLSIAPENLDLFRARLNGLARRCLTPEMLRPSLRLDAEVTLSELTLEQLHHLDQLQPTGQGNPVINLMARRLNLQRPPQRIGKDSQHAKFWITNGGDAFEAVWWGANDSPLPGGRFDLAFEPQLNEYNGRRTVQLKVLDWRPAT